MSELKAINAYQLTTNTEDSDVYIHNDEFGCGGDLVDCYLKSEADKVITHQKYKRCLAKKDECRVRSLRYQDLWEKWRETEHDTSGSYYRNYIKWWHRAMKWKNLAEYFKTTPNSTAQQGKG